MRRLTVESVVFHHGAGRWTAPVRVNDLLDGSGLDGYRLVSWRAVDAADPEPLDLPAITLGLGGWTRTDLPSELPRLGRLVQRFGDETLDQFVARNTTAILDSRGMPRKQLKEPMTMEMVVRAYTQGLQDFARRHQNKGERRGERQGREQGIREGREQEQARMLHRIVVHAFGSAAAEALSRMLATPMGPGRMRLLEDAALECDSAADFLIRAREVADRD